MFGAKYDILRVSTNISIKKKKNFPLFNTQNTALLNQQNVAL